MEQERFPANLYRNAYSGEGEGKWLGPKVSLRSHTLLFFCEAIRAQPLRKAIVLCSFTPCLLQGAVGGVCLLLGREWVIDFVKKFDCLSIRKHFQVPFYLNRW